VVILTWLIELGVGLACVVVGGLAVRNPRMRLVGVVLVVAGLAAATHAVVRLVEN